MKTILYSTFYLWIFSLLWYHPCTVTAQHHDDAIVSFQDNGQPPRIYAFYAAATGQLHTNYFDGTTWRWANQGNPSYTRISGKPGVISFKSGNNRPIYAFAVGRYSRTGWRGNGSYKLYVNYWNGYRWNWADQGLPANVQLSAEPGVITYRDSRNIQRIYAFVSADDGKLYVNYWNGYRWYWADQGNPPNTTVWSPPGVVSFKQNNQEHIYAFVTGRDGNLYANVWNGSRWSWINHGKPSGGSLIGKPTTITFNKSGNQIYAFCRGTNGKLYTRHFNGRTWRWADQGLPNNMRLNGIPSATQYFDQQGNARIYTFAVGEDKLLYVNYFDGRRWRWANQGTPNNIRLNIKVGAVSYRDAFFRHQIYGFVEVGKNGYASGDVYANHWDGTQWRWVDQQWGLFSNRRQFNLASSPDQEASLNPLDIDQNNANTLLDAPLQIFPNPFKNQFTISNTSDVTSLSIISPTGQVIHTQTNINEAEVVLDLPHLPANIYTIKMETDQGTITKRIMKQE